MSNRIYFQLAIPAAALVLLACNAVRAEFAEDNNSNTQPAASASATAKPDKQVGEGETDATATPSPTSTATTKPKKQSTAMPEATATPKATTTATPAKRSSTALTDQIPDCEDLLSGAEERFRHQMSSSHNNRGADSVTLGCSTGTASITVTVMRFTDKSDAERGDSLLKRSSPFNLKDRSLDLESISADVVGGVIAPDELGGLVTVGFRTEKITASIAAQPTSYGKHVEGNATTLAAKLAEALK
jgi:hypothetical protein